MKISQRESMRLKKRVEALETILKDQRMKWRRDFPTGVLLGQVNIQREFIAGRIEAARMLQHAVVVTEENNGVLSFYALPHAKMPI